MPQITPRTIVLTTLPNKLSISTAAVNINGNAYRRQLSVPCVVSSATTEMEGLIPEAGPRKRRRLTHLTPEERLMRRKLKNRVAAQLARDRKKERMSELEETLADVSADNQVLTAENDKLRDHAIQLEDENAMLRERLGLTCDDGEVMVTKKEPASPGSAEGDGAGFLPDDIALPVYDHDSQPDVLCGLQQPTDDKGCTIETQEPIHITATSTSFPTTSTVTVVGATPEELESLKELIRFDHIYHKSEPQPSPVPHNVIRNRSPVNILPKMCSNVAKPIFIVKDLTDSTPVTATVNVERAQASLQEQIIDVPVKQEVSTSENLDSTVTDLNLDVDGDLLSLEDSLEQLFDLDDLLNENLFSITSPTTAPELTAQIVPGQGRGSGVHDHTSISSEVQSQSIDTCNGNNPRKRKLSSEKLVQKIKHLSVEVGNPGSPLNTGISSPPVAALDYLSPLPHSSGSLSDSGYNSDFGEAVSPSSVLSLGDTDCDLSLDDTFTELFPTLL